MSSRLHSLAFGVKGLVVAACCFIALGGWLLPAPATPTLTTTSFVSRHRLQNNKVTYIDFEALRGQQPRLPNSWLGIEKPFFFFCYSAYLDVRILHRGEKLEKNIQRVVVHSVGPILQYVEVRWCVLHYKNGTKSQAMRALSQGVYSGRNSDGKATVTTFCRFQSSDAPLFISLLTQPDHNSTVCRNMTVRRPHKPAKMKPLGLCVSPIYRAGDCPMCRPKNISDELLPWIEMQRLLGVDGMTIYYQSHYGRSSTILEYYRKIGFAEVVYQSAPPGYRKKVPNSNALHDCLYRNMYKYEKILMLDLDEYIIPRNEKGFVELIKDVANSSNVQYEDTQFWFANTLFYTDNWQAADKYEPRSRIFMYRHHLAPQAFPGSCKSIVDPRICNIATAHMCLYTLYGKHGSVVKVDPSLARLHHYKDCKTNWWKPANHSCPEVMKSLQRDDIMLSYKTRLLERVDIVEKDMQNIMKKRVESL